MDDTELSGRIIGCAMAAHTALGPGLLENVYEDGIKRVVYDA